MAKGDIRSGNGAIKMAYAYGAGEFDRATDKMRDQIFDAEHLAMKDTGEAVKTGGRRAIAAGGFSKKWQNAFRVNLYPKRGRSANPAVFAYHKIPYAGVFAEGATISGKPFMWLPLPHIPRKMGGKKTTPEAWAKRFGTLIRIEGPSGPILLGKRRKKDMEPIFVGLSTVTLRKRFDLDSVFTREADRIRERYLRHLKV